MKKLFLIFLLAILACLYAQSEKKSYKLKENELRLYESLTKADANSNLKNIQEDENLNSALVLEANDYKTSFYLGEVFAIKLKAKTDEKSKFSLQTSFDKTPDLLLLNENAKWVKTKNGYENTFYFEAKSVNAKLLKIILSLMRNNKAFKTQDLLIKKINFKSLNPPLNYANLIANNLEVGLAKTTRYNDESIITLIHLKAENANLKDFSLKGMIKQGIEDVEGNFSKASGYYFAVSKENLNKLNFSYFDLDKNKFIDFTKIIKLDDESISTQSDLNPRTSKYEHYKQAFIIILILVFALLFLFFKSYVALFIAVLCLIFYLFITKDTAEAMLKAGARAQILPTINSTFFYTNERKSKVEILDYRKNYVKILLPNQKIGWVHKNELEDE